MNVPALIPVSTAQLPRCLTQGSRRMGWVYCVRDDLSEAVKIGFSRNPERRFSQLQTANPNQLRLIGVCEAVEAFETFLHWAHRDRRISGEWFDDADCSVSRIFHLMTESAS